MWCRSPKRKRQFWGCPGHSKALRIFTAAVAVAFVATGIIQLPIRSCSKRDHSVCQGSANSIREIFGTCDAAYRPRRSGGIAQRGRSVISTIASFAVKVQSSKEPTSVCSLFHKTSACVLFMVIDPLEMVKSETSHEIIF